VSSGDVVEGETVSSVPSSAGGSADLVLAEDAGVDGAEVDPVEALFVGLPATGGISTAP
jgi:hypothetical protein